MTFWNAPTLAQPFNARVPVPGSKSITNRALVLAALATQPSTLQGVLRSRDTNLMIAALESFGVSFTCRDQPLTSQDTTMVVTPPLVLTGGNVHCGLAGTVMRFLPPVAGLAQSDTYFDADEQAYARPIAPMFTALKSLGLSITHHRAENALPATISPKKFEGGAHTLHIDASSSSQFVSGLLLSAARLPFPLTITHTGASAIPSQPHLDMTVDMLTSRGVHVDTATPSTWTVQPGDIKGLDEVIEPDLSNATAFLAAAAISQSSVSIPHWPRETTQAGAYFAQLVHKMGADVSYDDAAEVLTVRGTGILNGVDVNLADHGELAPTIAAVALFADSPSCLRGIAHLRGHETDRLAALVAEISALGGHAEETEDGIRIYPTPLRGGRWRSYADHRMATAGAIIGVRVPGVSVENIETTSKTLPDFVSMWTDMLSDADTVK